MGAQIGYGKLMEQVCGVSLEKQESFSNWLARPLRAAQLSYARDDVRHLLVARDRLAARVDERGRRAWLDEELRRLEDPARFNQDPLEAWRRISGARDLDPRSHVAIRNLAAWREELARSRNVPRQRVLADKSVLEFARRRPATEKDLLATRGLRRGFHEVGEVLAVIQRSNEESAELPKKSRKKDRNQPAHPDKHVVSLVSAVLGALSKKAGVDSSLLANRREIEGMVCWHGEESFERSQYRLLNGWRYELIGRDVMDFLEGRVSVQIDPDSGQPAFVALGTA
jgi:ribonuclease D